MHIFTPNLVSVDFWPRARCRGYYTCYLSQYWCMALFWIDLLTMLTVWYLLFIGFLTIALYCCLVRLRPCNFCHWWLIETWWPNFFSWFIWLIFYIWHFSWHSAWWYLILNFHYTYIWKKMISIAVQLFSVLLEAVFCS